MTQSDEAARLADTVIIISPSTTDVDVELAPLLLIESFGPAVLLAGLEAKWPVIEDETIGELDAAEIPKPVKPRTGDEESTSVRMSAAVTGPVVPSAFWYGASSPSNSTTETGFQLLASIRG